jgi:lactam utilization protein B
VEKLHKLTGEKTRDVAAEKAGFGNHETYQQAAKVVEKGTSTLIQAMDDGWVSISAASILVDADQRHWVVEARSSNSALNRHDA